MNKEASVDVVVAIPAFNPAAELVALVDKLKSLGTRTIVVVDDGSGLQSQSVFERLETGAGNVILRHNRNLGKGRALKTAIEHICATMPGAKGIVTADADGQHTAEDIVAVAARFGTDPQGFVIGRRTFRSDVPWKSRIGNRLTSFLFLLLVGYRIYDTQSGLRGIPIDVAKSLVAVEGERYEYELNVLLSLKQFGVKVVEQPVSTLYFNNNRGTNFNPLLDSMKVYFVLLRFAGSSLVASLFDFLVFVILFAGTHSLAGSMIGGRVGSSMLNLLINREFVFKAKNRSSLMWQAAKYYSLVAFLATTAYFLIKAGTAAFGWPVLISKMFAESFLFIVSFAVQRDIVFGQQRQSPADGAPGAATRGRP